MRRIAVLYNARSGAAAADEAPVDQRLAATLEQHGVEADLREFDPWTVRQDIDVLVSARPDAVIVAGGDGTVKSVAEYLIPTGVPLGVVPMGTMNVLARDLGIPDELEAAVDALLSAPVRWIDVARVNDDVFLCSSALAMLPHLGRVREQAREARGLAMLRVLRKAVRVVRRYPRHRLRLVVDGETHTHRTRAVVVSNNPLASEPALVPGRERLDTGRLAAYVARDRTKWDLVMIAAKLLDGTWQHAKRLRTYHGRTVEISSEHLELVSVMNDGESVQLSMPLRYEILPKALAVLVPGERG
ncbi:MAG TPA: diacylglycerol kinase family protein [Actinopolymorphaceae bacterium]